MPNILYYHSYYYCFYYSGICPKDFISVLTGPGNLNECINVPGSTMQ